MGHRPPCSGHRPLRPAVGTRSPPKPARRRPSCTLGEGDGLLLQQEVHQHLGDRTGGIADVHHREVAEEEVHGQVQGGVQSDQEQDEPVAQQGQQIGGPKQDEESSLGLPVTGEPQ